MSASPSDARMRTAPGWRLAGKRPPAVIERAQDLAVTAIAKIAWHSPNIDGPGEPEYPDMNARGVRLPCVVTPIAAVAENREPPDVDVDAFGHVNIDVPEGGETGYLCLPRIHGGVAEIEVEVPEDARGEGPPPQPEPSAPHDMAQQGHGETGRPAARTGRLHQRVGQVILEMREFTCDTGPQRGVSARAELLERQPARDHVLSKRGEGL